MVIGFFLAPTVTPATDVKDAQFSQPVQSLALY